MLKYGLSCSICEMSFLKRNRLIVHVRENHYRNIDRTDASSHGKKHNMHADFQLVALVTFTKRI